MLKKLFAYFIFLPYALSATELKPWYGNDLELESRSTLTYQNFKNVATAVNHTKYRSNDLFLNQSFAISLMQYAAEVEMMLAATREQHFNIDHLKLTGRYQILDDIVDDPFSLVAGVSIAEVGRPALHDPASFHHGLFEVEPHVAIGKEISKGEFWLKRYFALFAIGFGQGSPWLRADFNYAIKLCGNHEFELFIKSLFGLGGKRVRLYDFNGYGPIRHRSVDLGFKYAYYLDNLDAYLIGEYSYRVFAENYPKNASRLALTFFYPFGLGI